MYFVFLLGYSSAFLERLHKIAISAFNLTIFLKKTNTKLTLKIKGRRVQHQTAGMHLLPLRTITPATPSMSSSATGFPKPT